VHECSPISCRACNGRSFEHCGRRGSVAAAEDDDGDRDGSGGGGHGSRRRWGGSGTGARSM
jgi:hypothetical protein